MKFHNPENIRNISFYVQRDYSTIDSLQTFSLCLFSVMGRWLSDDENFFHLHNISHFSMIFTIKFDKTSFEIRFISKSVKVCSLSSCIACTNRDSTSQDLWIMTLEGKYINTSCGRVVRDFEREAKPSCKF